MNTLFNPQVMVFPPPIVLFNWGRCPQGGGGPNAQTYHSQNLRTCKTTSSQHDRIGNKALGTFTSAPHGRCSLQEPARYWKLHRGFLPTGDAAQCVPREKLIIDVDGSQHLEQEEYDEERTAFLKSKGYRVLRFWNNDVMNNIDSVLRVIYEALNNGATP